MSVDDAKWIAGLLLPAFPLNMGLISYALNDKARQPLRLAFLVNGLYILVTGLIGYFVTKAYTIPLAVCCLCFTMLAYVVYQLKQRDIKGIDFGEYMIKVSRLINVQISYILVELADSRSNVDVDKLIQNGLDYILDKIGEIIGLEEKKRKKKNIQHSLSVFLVRDDGKFTPMAHYGINSTQVEYIEKTFRYKPKVVSIAGYAVHAGNHICIADLEKSRDEAAKYWAPTGRGEKKEGFILCYVIMRGVGKTNGQSKPMAVICLSSEEVNAYDRDSVIAVLDNFSPQIENMLYARLIRKKN